MLVLFQHKPNKWKFASEGLKYQFLFFFCLLLLCTLRRTSSKMDRARNDRRRTTSSSVMTYLWSIDPKHCTSYKISLYNCNSCIFYIKESHVLFIAKNKNTVILFSTYVPSWWMNFRSRNKLHLSLYTFDIARTWNIYGCSSSTSNSRLQCNDKSNCKETTRGWLWRKFNLIHRLQWIGWRSTVQRRSCQIVVV